METAERAPLLNIERLSKRLGSTQALDNVSFHLARGELLAVVGENGAGKSTLTKLLYGELQPDTGKISLEGVVFSARSPTEALRGGIVRIPQELQVVPSLTIAENIFLEGFPERRALGFLPAADRPAAQGKAGALLSELGLSLDPASPVDKLNFAERQLVMIARALSCRAKVLILDEPTAALQAAEAAALFATLRRLASRGVAIIYISHRLKELREICDRAIVLRDGRLVATHRCESVDEETLIRDMTGGRSSANASGVARELGPVVLEAGILDGTIAARSREIIGFAGLLGSGIEQVVRAVFGAIPDSAPVTIRGVSVARPRPAKMVRQRLGLIVGARSEQLFYTLSVLDNIVMPHVGRFGRVGSFDRKGAERAVRELLRKLGVRPNDPYAPVARLSGGNQQKVLFARWFVDDLAALLLDEPSAGIDVAAKAQVQKLVQEFADRGGAVLVSSSDIPELLALADRILAVRDQAIRSQFKKQNGFDERRIRSAVGG